MILRTTDSISKEEQSRRIGKIGVRENSFRLVVSETTTRAERGIARPRSALRSLLPLPPLVLRRKYSPLRMPEHNLPRLTLLSLIRKLDSVGDDLDLLSFLLSYQPAEDRSNERLHSSEKRTDLSARGYEDVNERRIHTRIR